MCIPTGQALALCEGRLLGLIGRIKMRVDRLQLEIALRGGGYVVGVTSWDGVKGRLCHLRYVDKLSYTEMCDVVMFYTDSFRPGTEFFPTEDQTFVQAPLFD